MVLPADARLFAVVPAAGQGTRMGAALPKQYLTVHGRTVAEHTLQRLLAMARIDKVVVATASEDLWWPQLAVAHHARVRSALGGASRAESVLNALQSLSGDAHDSDWVLVHDIARPCVRLSDIEKLVQAVDAEGAILALPVTDTIKQSADGRVAATLERNNVWRALTPQLFPLGALRDALDRALAEGLAVTDEASAMEAAGWHPALVRGSDDNIKLTLPTDLPLVRFYLSRQDEEGLTWQSA